MFGRVRASSCSVDSLERPPSKIVKDDLLSVYEATLMKLKLGSQHDLSSPFEEAVEMESGCSNVESTSTESRCTSPSVLKGCQSLVTSTDEEVMTIDTDFFSASTHLCSTSCQCTSDLKKQRSKNASILYLFSRYNNSRHALTLSCGGAMMTGSNGSPSSSPTSSNCQFLGSTKGQSQHECLSSSSVRQM